MALLEDDPELKDLVTQTLEQNGLLKKIKAQLRAGVFLALEDSDSKQHLNLENQQFKDFVEKPEGAVITCLVREFLEYFGFDYTLCVFDPESGQGKEFIYPGRDKLANQIGLEDVGDNKPLLGHILLNFENTIVEDSIAQENDKTFILDNDSSNHQAKDSNQNKSSKFMDQIKGDNKNMNEQNYSVPKEKISLPETSIDEENDSYSRKTFQEKNPLKKNEEKILKNSNFINQTMEASQNKKYQKEDEKKKENSISSLSDLPPLINQKSKENLGQLKAVVELSLESTSEPQYEEDFEDNVNTPKESEKQDSESDIQEEIEYVDDLLSLSTAVDDLTVSATISTAAAGPRGDYSESI